MNGHSWNKEEREQKDNRLLIYEQLEKNKQILEPSLS